MTTAPVKCLVWDLDGTLWDGCGDAIPFADAVRTLRTLDQRGVLHAVACRGEPDVAAAHLAGNGLLDLFTWVEVGRVAKSESIKRVAAELDIALDAIAFIAGDPTERAEVAAALPTVRCYPAEEAVRLPELGGFAARHATAESRGRRHLYRAEQLRKQAEAEHVGPTKEFMKSLDLVLRVRPADPADLSRTHELADRAHQLNTTGRTFAPDELLALCASPRHEVLVAELSDRFGSHGTVGLAVTAFSAADSVIELLVVSCRVVSRGAGAALVDHLIKAALADGRRPVAEFVRTEANRVMLITLRFAGFAVVHESDGQLTLAVDPRDPPAHRPHPVRVERTT
ncbi:FkbH like protein [Alloactinosynnema sp. L-07]|uniref:HAD-IIIC family phosphatase n=1 Tax=Alloactinosynnema sp. L-07 TaxID=1653480 RepID=UPI00065EF331|nr:hypothetical protein [Alloactinosynnema sp. L-07]CRK57370.1 FkbH like protein [Alloactinosynnema sp. L-07]